MKRHYHCPNCGNSDVANLFITNHNGKALSLLLSSQATIRKSSGRISCARCNHIGSLIDFNG